MSVPSPAQALNLDKNAQREFIKFYNDLDEKTVTTVRFFNRIDYYTVHGTDTEVAGKILHTLSNQKLMSPGEMEPLSYLSLSKGEFENVVRELLLVRNYRVEVYIKEKNVRQSDWKLEYKGSPGNLIQFEDVLFYKEGMVSGSAMIATMIRNEGKQRIVGLACIDCTDSVMSLTEFLDDEYFAELEATVVLLSPRECILPSSEGDYSVVKNLMERNNVMVTIRRKADFSISETDIIRDLNKLLQFEKGQQENANTLPEARKKMPLVALGAAIKYMALVQDDSNFGQFNLKLLNVDRFVHLDAAAVRALNLLPKRGTNIYSVEHRLKSVLGVLDQCRTSQGHRLLAQWVKQPLRNEALLRDRHNIIDCLLDCPSALQVLYDVHLKRIPDILMLVKRLKRKKATLQDLYRIYEALVRCPLIIEEFDKIGNVSVSNILSQPLKDTMSDLKLLKEMIEQVIDFDSIQKWEFFVKSSFDPNLENLKNKLDKKQAEMDELHKNAIEEMNLKSVKLEHAPHLGYHLRVTLKDENAVRKHSKYKILDTVKSGVRFTTAELQICSVERLQIREDYEEQQCVILTEIIKVAIGYLKPLTTLNIQLAEVDCLVSFAIVAKSAPKPYVKPKILPEGSGVLELKGVRHPCLELQEHVSYIPNDVSFKAGESTLYVITGPNMGGKSTLIRSVGVAVLMAHVGSFVPCDEAVISMVDAILGRIGATDDISKGMSTFMVEMVETASIIRTTTENSLVIIDELGRGTSTYDGLGLAWAIAEHLAERNRSFSLFATHFHEISELSKTTPTVRSYYMDAIVDDGKLTFLYKLKMGAMLQSFGINIARLVNFPEEVINVAEANYEEVIDHVKHLASDEDKELASYVEAAVFELLQNESKMSDADIEELAVNCQRKIRSSNSEYFRKSFPGLLDEQK